MLQNIHTSFPVALRTLFRLDQRLEMICFLRFLDLLHLCLFEEDQLRAVNLAQLLILLAHFVASRGATRTELIT